MRAPLRNSPIRPRIAVFFPLQAGPIGARRKERQKASMLDQPADRFRRAICHSFANGVDAALWPLLFFLFLLPLRARCPARPAGEARLRRSVVAALLFDLLIFAGATEIINLSLQNPQDDVLIRNITRSPSVPSPPTNQSQRRWWWRLTAQF